MCNPVFQYFRSPYRHHVVNTLLIENDVCLFLMMRARSAALSSISRGNCGIQNIFVGTVMKSEQKKKNNQDIIEMLFDVVHLVNSCMQINSSKVHWMNCSKYSKKQTATWNIPQHLPKYHKALKKKIKTRFARLKQKTNGSVAQRWLSLGFWLLKIRPPPAYTWQGTYP